MAQPVVIPQQISSTVIASDAERQNRLQEQEQEEHLDRLKQEVKLARKISKLGGCFFFQFCEAKGHGGTRRCLRRTRKQFLGISKSTLQ